MYKLILPAAAAALFAGTAMAQTTVGGGVAASGPQGSVVGGATAGTMPAPASTAKDKRDRKSHADRKADRAASANSSSTYGSGSVYTDRNRATGAVTAGGTATGTGSQASSTSIDAYGSTTKSGSEGEVYGDSTATSTVPPK